MSSNWKPNDIDEQEKSSRTLKPSSSDVYKFHHRTYDCEDSLSEGKGKRFLKSTKYCTKSVEFDQPSMEIHGGWMFPDEHYELILPSPKDNETDEEEECTKIYINGKPRQEQCISCCCCRCMQTRMKQCCCCCNVEQQSCYSDQRQKYYPDDARYKRQDGRKRSQGSAKKNSSKRSTLSLTQSDKNYDAELRCTKDMDLATMWCNKANEGFSNGVDEKSKQKSSANKSSTKRRINKSKSKPKQPNRSRSKKANETSS